MVEVLNEFSPNNVSGSILHFLTYDMADIMEYG